MVKRTKLIFNIIGKLDNCIKKKSKRKLLTTTPSPVKGLLRTDTNGDVLARFIAGGRGEDQLANDKRSSIKGRQLRPGTDSSFIYVRCDTDSQY
ncbi:hypothetical protein DPMN_093086 [Dreissena polymorpha]|uniref:Uncharacterized protein n=1 Tax=Dreissena polymorpha TaxID=45954 RepID=A0A9D4L550_DREPO|nr:hypothetical protein DPMN_093086 [Dreissena polymorpha]